MNNIPGFQILETLSNNNEISVFKAIQIQTKDQVVIKTNSSSDASPKVLAKISHEYEIVHDLNSKGIIKPKEKILYEDGIALIFDEYEGISLKEFIMQNKLDLKTNIEIALKIVNTITDLHSQNLIHKDIKPDNIIINLNKKEIRIIDFGISTKINLKTQHLGNPEVLEGTLFYISPEQTGRMNRIIDYRSDLYSLGVTLYELFTGILPFNSNDPMELVHSHIAVSPQEPHKINPIIPLSLSKVILKLMEKNAEERYQSASGILFDLNRIKNNESNFALAEKDFSGRFQISQKLYGRSEEVNTLLETFERTTKGSTEIILVSGFSGVGKSALVNEVHKPITEKRGNFISGKYDQFQKNIPYYAIKQAFEEFSTLLLTFSKKDLESWKEKILSSVGANGQVLVDVIPNLELVIGKQEAVATLGPQESQNRFNLVFQNFIKAIATKNHPLVMFIDDLQWADSASLNLLKVIMTDSENHNLLLIGAYRDNEVDASHPFIMTMEEIKKTGLEIKDIVLKNLTKEDVNELVSDALATDATDVFPVTELVYSKTSGNAFFTNEFLKSLYEENLLKYDFSSNKWIWDIDKIHDQGITDNVVELMTQKLGRLQLATQEVLKYASCIGNKFELRILSIIHEKSQYDTFRDLWKGVEEGLVFPLDENYKMIQSIELHEAFETVNKFEFKHDTIQEAASQLTPESKEESSQFKFGHDRIQQASYALIPDDRKKEIHLKIGRLLLSNTSFFELEERIFDIVNQFNNSLDLVHDREEKIQIAELNLKAGKKAKLALASNSAKEFLEHSIHLLNDFDWNAQYQLKLDTWSEAVEVNYLLGNFPLMEKYAEEVIQNSKTILDRIRIYIQKIRHNNSIGLQEKAIDNIALPVLKELGVSLPNHPTQLDIVTRLLRVKFAIGFRRIEDILSLPELKDEKTIAIFSILTEIIGAAFFARSNLFPILSFTTIELSLKYGNHPQSTSAYSTYAMVLSGILFDFKSGYRFTSMALKLADQLKGNALKPISLLVHGFFIIHFQKSLKDAISYEIEAGTEGLNFGNYEYSSYGYSTASLTEYFLGNHLPKVEESYRKYFPILLKLNQNQTLGYTRPFFQMAITLQGKELINDKLAGEIFDYRTHIPQYEKENLHLPLFYAKYLLGVLLYHHHEYEESLKEFVYASQYIDKALCSQGLPDYYLFFTLLCFELIQLDSSKYKYLKKYYNSSLSIMKKISKSVPFNYMQKYMIMLAKKEEAFGNKMKAIELYENSIQKSNENGFIQDEALANEMLTKLYFKLGKMTLAKAYLQESHRLYSKWGAMAKVKFMESKYPQIFTKVNETIKEKSKTITLSNTNTATTVATTGMLDMASVLKSSQALSGEIQLEKLLSKMMTIVLENAGAEKGVLLLEENDNLLIQARGTSTETKVMESLVADMDEFVPDSVIQYVYRTKETIVLNNASKEGNFTQSKYVIEKKPKSVICTPITKQGKLFGILYLENNLTTGAFTRDRIETLSILSSQVAVSIENALLYDNLEQKVEERTFQLRESMKGTQDILSNVEQGIMTINRDFSINPDYSRKVLEIFGVKELLLKDFRELIMVEKKNKVTTYIELLFSNPFMSAKMFEKSNPLKEYTYLSLQEGGIVKQLSFSFSRIFKLDNESHKTDEIEKIMVVIDDRTAEYELQKQLEAKTKEQASKVEKMYQILGMDAKIFSGFIKEANETIDLVKPKLQSLLSEKETGTEKVIEKNRKIIEETFRAVHSLKGNARALNLESIGERAHKLEDELDKLRNNVSEIKKEFIERTLKALEEFHVEIQDGSSIFDKILGMKSALGGIADTDTSKEVSAIDELKFFLTNLLNKESKDIGKEINFVFEKEGNDIPVEIIQKLKNPLIQILKNSLDHGIEKSEIRREHGKQEKGTIKIKLISSKEKLIVDCEDDGAGLNLDRIKNKAIEVGLMNPDILSKMTKEDIYQLIFHPGFSTADKVTSLSGRGVGMDIVKDDIEKLGGKIRIDTLENSYTKFRIKFD